MLEPARARGAQQGKPLGHRRRHRLFAIDMLARRDRLAQRRYPLHGRRRVEEHREVRPPQGRIEIGRPAVGAGLARDIGEPFGIATDQQQPRHDAVGARREPALGADRRQRIGQMLRGGDASGRAVDDDADILDRH